MMVVMIMRSRRRRWMMPSAGAVSTMSGSVTAMSVTARASRPRPHSTPSRSRGCHIYSGSSWHSNQLLYISQISAWAAFSLL